MVKLPHWPIHTGNASTDSIALMKHILGLMGNPQQKLKNIIHVGGTNGKGSTIAFLSQILRQEGFTVNVYTSPHIFNFTERFSLNGENTSTDEVFMALEEVRSVCEKHGLYPTVLEASTVAAFHLFARQNADYNIIECCM
ncbi:MAG: bifunctional folylpolyglutamate synthase/dihydrofolate synthase, partial [Proteobacteria bacterium]|nr:bifunctional folylpolyglutamate synthase/dihydrofolate synthase [Pseudomonadota bacterium]